MSTRLMRMTALCIALCSSGVFAQGTPSYTRFLIPIYTADTPGAYGSLWQSATWLRYSGTEEASIVPRASCFGIMCPAEGRLGPGEPSLPFQHLAGFPEPAILVHVESTQAAKVTFASRVRDLSRENDSAGTDVPVIREDRMSATPIYLLNVPMGPRFRQMLRLYALPDVADPEVEVRYFRQPDATGPAIDLSLHLLRVDRVRLRMRPSGDIVNLFPALAEIGNVDRFPELAGEKAIWLEVTPLTPGMRIWAMTSITNNATQQVTLVTPNL